MADKSFKVKNGIQIGTTTEVTSIVDEDNMASNSATALSTQQSIKAYVDAQVAASDTFLELSDTQASFTANGVIGTNASGNATVATELLVTASSNDITVANGTSDKDVIFAVNDGGSATTEVFRLDGDVSALKIASGKQLQIGAAEENISGDGTDITFAVGSGGDINIPADIGLTFGDDGEKIEGDGTDLTIAGNNINLTAVADVKIPVNIGLMFGTHEKIESDDTDLTITVGSNGDINIPANIGLKFGDDGEGIEGDGTDLTITGNTINLSPTTDVVLPANKGVVFGDAAEKIEGDGTDLTVTGNNIVLSPTADVKIPVNKGLLLGTHEKIESDDTDLTITVGSGGDINIGADIGLTFGDDGEKIEGDGTNLTIASSGALSINNTGVATFSGAVQVNGNFTVLGSQSILETVTTEIEDNLIAINSKNSGGADLDAGIHINRGSTGNNAVFYWNEGDDKFKAVLSNSASTVTAVTDSSTATIVATFEGNITGDVTGTADTATEATNVTASANNSTDETCFPTFVDGATGTQGIETDTGFTYNPSDGTLTATVFSGGATQVNTQSRATDAAHYLTFVTDNNGSATAESLFTDAGIAYNPSGNLLTTTVTAARYSDLAEVFPTNTGESIEAGTVVCFTGDKKVGICDQDSHTAVAGIVSTKPGLLMNVEGDGVDLALTGRVPVKVTGNINAGDLLVSAGGGRARAEATPAIGTVIGKAIESHAGGDGVIDAFAMMM